jgi:transcriptional antiterminator NusG
MKENSDFAYYALQVKTRGEINFMRRAGFLTPEIALSLYFPQRALDIRKGGFTKPFRLPVFPGYVFLELPSDSDVYHYLWAFREIEGFYRFLRSNKHIDYLKDKDLSIVLHFIKRVGAVAEKSKVYFNENSRIVILEGPLKGLEGNIVNVDRRKRRAKIKLDLYDDSFTIDLAFEVIEKGRIQCA